MKLTVRGIAQIEITDPQGLCNPPAPVVGIPALPARLDPYNPFDGLLPPAPTTNPPFIDDSWRTRPHFPTVHDPAKWQTKLTGDPPELTGDPLGSDNWARGMTAALADDPIISRKADGNKRNKFQA